MRTRQGSEADTASLQEFYKERTISPRQRMVIDVMGHRLSFAAYGPYTRTVDDQGNVVVF
jgi:hypothetical protein